MKKCFVIVLALFLWGCDAFLPGETMDTVTQPTTEPVCQTQPTEESTQAPTLPAHSDLYREEFPLEQIAEYFNEVVFSAEYAEGDGDPALVQKWTEPVVCTLSGDPTDEDIAVLTELFAGLNRIKGFPGISFTGEGQVGNVTVHFLNEEDFNIEFADFLHYEPADGAVQFWYDTETNEIYTARVGYRTDIGQDIRNSVLLEEIINMLGLNDTELRQDSILYQYGSEVTALSDMDWLILELLYHPSITCGMDCTTVTDLLPTIYY